MRQRFLIFLHLNCEDNNFLSSCLLRLKNLLILEILQEALSEFPTLAAPQRELETSIQPLKKLTANHL